MWRTWIYDIDIPCVVQGRVWSFLWGIQHASFSSFLNVRGFGVGQGDRPGLGHEQGDGGFLTESCSLTMVTRKCSDEWVGLETTTHMSRFFSSTRQRVSLSSYASPQKGETASKVKENIAASKRAMTERQTSWPNKNWRSPEHSGIPLLVMSRWLGVRSPETFTQEVQWALLPLKAYRNIWMLCLSCSDWKVQRTCARQVFLHTRSSS